MNCNLYSVDNIFLNKCSYVPYNFTGIAEYSNGDKSWWVKGKWHRLDGPAVEWKGGIKYWYVDDKEVTEEQCKLLYDIMKLKGLL